MDNRYYFEKQEGNSIIIKNQEATHLSKVRRANIGDEIVAFCGDGLDYHAKITTINKDKVTAEILSKSKNRAEAETQVLVYLASLKHEALTTAIDYLTEQNVKICKIFQADRSVAEIDEKKLTKLKNISIQACKQCERASAMQIELIKKEDIKRDAPKYKNVFFAYENADENIKPFSGEFAVIIGPEGGFSEREVSYFSSFASTISLGKTILRAEVACASSISALRAVRV